MTTIEKPTTDTETDVQKISERRFLVFATNPAISYAAYLDTFESVVCAGFETSDLDALMPILHGGMSSGSEKIFPNDTNIWFPITVIELENFETLGRKSILRHFDRVYSPPGIMNIRYRDDYTFFAREECNRLLSLNWQVNPTIFTISACEIVDHPLYEHLTDHTEVNYYNENIIIKQIVDKKCEAFCHENVISINRQF